MEIIHANESNFSNYISDGKVLVDFFANWCGPCKMLSPILEELCEERNEFKIIKINVDECETLARKFGVMSIPTLILFKDGKEIDKKIGFMSKDDLNEWINNN